MKRHCSRNFRHHALTSIGVSVSSSDRQEVPDPLTASPSRVAVNETPVRVASEWYWLYTVVDLDSMLLLGVKLLRQWGASTAAFLDWLQNRHDLSETEFLVDGWDT